jgi:hypothetical protein
VDGIRKAADDFVNEQGLKQSAIATNSGMEILDLWISSGKYSYPIKYVVGNFFNMQPEVAGTFEVRLAKRIQDRWECNFSPYLAIHMPC